MYGKIIYESFLGNLCDISSNQQMDSIAPPVCVESPRTTTPFVVYDAMFWISGHNHDSKSWQITVAIGDTENSSVSYGICQTFLCGLRFTIFCHFLTIPGILCSSQQLLSCSVSVLKVFIVSNVCDLRNQNGTKKA